ncbi:amidohydrolase family protein [Terrimonas alba]|uniref:amidohydrolase family protein n=1 Tax=Terrimonas alba TaxID=3349636 RepID=UPI0035F3E845
MAVIARDPMDGPQYALRGRIVTMNNRRTVIDDGIVYIDKGNIIAVKKSTARPPAGFRHIDPINTEGIIYPGLIELHNHLSYNILRLWQVPKQYTNRDQWAGTAEYRKIISGPMNVLGKTPGYVEAIVRYVECKCLLGGVTTSQGIALFSNNGIQKYYRGVVRNVENTDDAELPEALAKISDVESASIQAFYQRLKKQHCLLLHLSEGTDPEALQHFNDLKLPDGNWAITEALSGIHCVALKATEFKKMAANKASMVWSPLSNLLLYGQTADIVSAVKNKLLIGIGSDWSASGSKNLFGELKVARLVSRELGVMKKDADILAMATINAARMLKWDKVMGSIEAGKRADLLVMTGTTGDPYHAFLNRSETAISLVVINGIARYGHEQLMNHWQVPKEAVMVGSKKYQLHLTQPSGDPVVNNLKLSDAIKKLKTGLQNLPQLAKDLETHPHRSLSIANAASDPQWFLVLDHNDEIAGEKLRLAGEVVPQPRGVPQPLSAIVEKMKLDEMTVADDRDFLNAIQLQNNLPLYIKKGLRVMYG